MEKPNLDIIIPVYNEETILEENILMLVNFLQNHMEMKRYNWQVIIADNGSKDLTYSLALKLSKTNSKIKPIKILQKGRGNALRKVWSESQSEFLAYMDVDLSTNLESFPELIKALEEGYDISIGTRLDRKAKIKRCLKREILSRGYNFLIKFMFFNRFSDAQCGFKAITKQIANTVLPFVENNNWFF